MSGPRPGAFESVTPDAARALVEAGGARVLDVRTPEEWAALGVIPGAALVPMDLVPSAAATLPRDGTPLLVVCEHGIRSAQAARLLAAAGIPKVMNLSGGMAAWKGRRAPGAGGPDPVIGPSSWLLLNADLLRPADGARGRRPEVLDLACGAGRHALLLAAAGLEVRAVDRDADAIDRLRGTAAGLALAIAADVVDLETGDADLGEARYDVVLGIHYLHRPLFPAIGRALRPGGALIYETFTTAQAARSRPRDPAHLLEPGELRRLAAGLEVLREREGEHEGRMVAGIAARRPS